MRKLLNYFMYFLLCGIVFMSCKEKDLPINEGPVIQFNSPIVDGANDDNLWGLINIEIYVKDSEGQIETVELFINDQSQGFLKEGPSSLYSYEWDSRDVNDGPVTLKAIAEDDQGQTSEAEIVIQISNLLVDLNIEYISLSNDPYFSFENDLFTITKLMPEFKHYLFITSNETPQTVLFVTELTSLPFVQQVRRPIGFEGIFFNIHLVVANDTEAYLNTYSDISPGIFKPFNEDKRGDLKGNANLNLIDTFGDFMASHLKNEEISEGEKVNVPVYENLNLGYVYIKNGTAGFYKIVEDLNPGQRDVSLNTMNLDMDQQNYVLTQDMEIARYSVWGHTGAELYSPKIPVFSYIIQKMNKDEQISFHTPPLATSPFEFFSTIMTEYPNGTLSRIDRQVNYNTMMTNYKRMVLDFTVNDNKLSELDVDISGEEFDVTDVIVNVVGNNAFKLQWRNYCNPYSDKIIFPLIPEEITEDINNFYRNAFVNQEENVIRIGALNYSHFDGYNDYIHRLSGRDGAISIIDENSTLNSGYEIFDFTKQF